MAAVVARRRSASKRRRQPNWLGIGTRPGGYRPAWSDRGVDQGTDEQNIEAAKRLGIEWEVTK